MRFPPAPAGTRALHPAGFGCASAFTLLELLIVLAVIGLLAALTLGAGRGTSQRAELGRARAELAVLAQVLADYKRHTGDYPQAADPAALYAALSGRAGPGRTFIEDARFHLADPGNPDDAGNCLVDPWGAPYGYVYYLRGDSPATGRTGYVLYSAGPRSAGEAQPAPRQVVPAASGAQGGVIDEANPLNARNLYAPGP